MIKQDAATCQELLASNFGIVLKPNNMTKPIHKFHFRILLPEITCGTNVKTRVQAGKKTYLLFKIFSLYKLEKKKKQKELDI